MDISDVGEVLFEIVSEVATEPPRRGTRARRLWIWLAAILFITILIWLAV
jgi:hypothetical protein